MKLRDTLDRITNNQAKIMADMEVIKVDLLHHIKRTDRLEEELKPIVKIYYFLQGAGVVIGVLAALAAIAKLFL